MPTIPHPKDVPKMTVYNLKLLLKERGLPYVGTKKVLVKRMLANYKAKVKIIKRRRTRVSDSKDQEGRFPKRQTRRGKEEDRPRSHGNGGKEEDLDVQSNDKEESADLFSEIDGDEEKKEQKEEVWIPQADPSRLELLQKEKRWVLCEEKVLELAEESLDDLDDGRWNDCNHYGFKTKISKDSESSEKYIERLTGDDWKGLLKVNAVPLTLEATQTLLDLSSRWINELSELVFEYIGCNEDWHFMVRHKVYLDLHRLEYLIRTNDMPNQATTLKMIEMAQQRSGTFPQTAAAFRKYKRPVPPKFGLSLIPDIKEIKGLTRTATQLNNLRRQVSDGWEFHSETLRLDNKLSKLLSSKLHHYQKRTILWARALENEVESGVSYHLPCDAMKYPNCEDSPVVFDWMGDRISLDQHPNLKQTIFTFQGGDRKSVV